MVRSVPATVFAVLLVLSGCSGLFGGGTSTPTVTPVDPPTGSPTATPVPVLAPGVTARGVQNASALASAHEAVLANESHTIAATETRRYADGTLQWQYDSDRRVAPTEARHHAVATISGTERPFGIGSLRNVSRFETYREGQQVHVFESNGTATRSVRTTGDAPRVVADPLVAVFSATETEVEGRVTRNGTTVHRLVVVEVTRPELLAGALARPSYDSVENASFSALVDSRGLVHEYRLAYTLHRGETTVQVTREVRFRSVGNTTVTRPPWYDDARATTTES